MAGPTASILLRSPLTPADRSRILAELSGLDVSLRGGSGMREGDNGFWLGDEHPFIVILREEDPYYPDELEDFADLDEHGLPTLLGWRPQDRLGFAAMCNGDEDHVLLAELCIRFAEQLDGVIDFGGDLSVGPDLSGPSPSPARRIDAPEGLAGVLYAAVYKSVAGTYATCHYGDAAFLRAFLGHPQFRMIK
jgi:hypothetical protein